MTGDCVSEKEEPLSLVPDFIENVEQYLSTHEIDNVDALIEKLQQKLQAYTMAENRALTRRQKQMERQAHLNKSIACVKMLRKKQESQDEAIVDYSLGGAKQILAMLQCFTIGRSPLAFLQPTSSLKPEFLLSRTFAFGWGLM